MGSEGKSATIYIVRHGETVGNTQRIILHPNEDVLNDVGKEQAKLLGENLRDVHFTKVYTSNYPRTKETASIIMECNKNPVPQSEIKVDPRLREAGMPSLYGKPYGYLLKGIIDFIQTGQNVQKFQMDDTESPDELTKRAKEAIQDVIRDSFSTPGNDTILIVSHGACIRSLMVGLSESNEFETTGYNPIGGKITRNTGVMKLSVKETDGKPHIHFEKFHDFSHYSKAMLSSDSLTRLVQTPEGKCLSGCFQV